MNQIIVSKLNNLLELGIKYNCPQLVKAIQQKYGKFEFSKDTTRVD